MFRVALDRAREIGRSEALASWVAEEVLPGEKMTDDAALDEFIARSVITHHHPVATCRMGADPDAITAPDLRMNGVDNLWIVDSSVIPTITCGPVHAAVMAIAESFADSFARSSTQASAA